MLFVTYLCRKRRYQQTIKWCIQLSTMRGQVTRTYTSSEITLPATGGSSTAARFCPWDPSTNPKSHGKTYVLFTNDSDNTSSKSSSDDHPRIYLEKRYTQKKWRRYDMKCKLNDLSTISERTFLLWLLHSLAIILHQTIIMN